MAKRVLHIGPPKTGTTALQQLLFSRHPEISHYALKSNFGRAPNQDWVETFLNRVTAQDEIVFDRRAAEAGIAQHIHGETVVVSNEAFGARYGIGISFKARRLKELFPDYSILMVIRNPVDRMQSDYVQEVRNAHARRLAHSLAPSFEEHVKRGLDVPDHPRSPLMGVRFHGMARLYADLFGRDRMKLLVFEQMTRDPTAFVTALAEFLGVDVKVAMELFTEGGPVNVQPSGDRLAYERLARASQLKLARFLPSGIRRAAARGVAKGMAAVTRADHRNTYLAPETEKRLCAFVAQEMAALEADWNLGLKEYGYPLI